MSLVMGSKLRKKVITYAFTHVDEKHYVRELASLIGEDAGNLSRELRRLEDEGIFSSSVKGKEKYYSLNRNYPLFDEFKKIVFKTEGVEGSLRQFVSGFKEMSMSRSDNM